MNDIRTKRFGVKLFSTVFLIFIIMGLAFIPCLLQSDSKLVPLTFSTTEQTAANDAVILRGSFDQDLPAHETLRLYAENAEIELHMNGMRTRFNTREDTPEFFRSPGSGWFAYVSPGIRAGQTMEITVRSYYGENELAVSNLLSRLSMGDGGELYKRMLGQIGFLGFFLIAVLIAGVIYLGEGAIDVAAGMESDGLRIAIFGFYCFSGGVWSLSDAFYPYLTLLVSPPWMAAILDVVGILLFPIALAAMIQYYMRGRTTRRILTVILAVEIIAPVVCLSLQLAGIADLFEQQTEIGMVALMSLVVAFICIAVELRSRRDGYLLLLMLTVLPVFAAIAVEGINLFWPFMPRRIIMRFSFGVSALMLMLQLASYAYAELIKVETLRQVKSELEESRISIMLSQIKPHFLYNTLLGIKQLCDTEPKKASDALSHFSYYLRGNLYSISDPRLIPFEKEVEHVQNYLYLEKMRFEERISIHWELDFTDFMLPSLTLQPLVENAIRHGITPKDGGGTLTIRSAEAADGIHLTITDDGVGFDTEALMEDSRPHIGIENVRKRIESQCGGNLQLYSTVGRGTEIRIVLPPNELRIRQGLIDEPWCREDNRTHAPSSQNK